MRDRFLWTGQLMAYMGFFRRQATVLVQVFVEGPRGNLVELFDGTEAEEYHA